MSAGLPAEVRDARCPAAHPDDPTPCDGPPVVTVLDAHNAGADGCGHHAARLLASLSGGRVYALPDAPSGAAIRVFNTADGIRPFPWLTDAPRTGPSRRSHAENRRQPDGGQEPVTAQLPADTRDLLATLLEGLDIPCPATIGDGETYERILAERTGEVIAVLRSVLRDHLTEDLVWHAAYLRSRLARYPATGYRAWGSPPGDDHR